MCISQFLHCKNLLMLSLATMKILTLLFIYKIIRAEDKGLGPIGDLKLVSLEKCEVEGDESIVTANFELVENENGDKVFNSKVNLKRDIDKSFWFRLDVEETNSGVTFALDGYICPQLVMLSGIWKKIAETVGVPLECPIPAGDYSLENFSISQEELEWPAVFYGHLLIEARLFKDDKKLLCAKFEIDSRPPK